MIHFQASSRNLLDIVHSKHFVDARVDRKQSIFLGPFYKERGLPLC